jgi:hypothetical protein
MILGRVKASAYHFLNTCYQAHAQLYLKAQN